MQVILQFNYFLASKLDTFDFSSIFIDIMSSNIHYWYHFKTINLFINYLIKILRVGVF